MVVLSAKSRSRRWKRYRPSGGQYCARICSSDLIPRWDILIPRFVFRGPAHERLACEFAGYIAVLNVSRHSLACGDFLLSAPLVTSSMKLRSWNSVNARLVLAASAFRGRAPGNYLLRCS
jgi:hypothetical protein